MPRNAELDVEKASTDDTSKEVHGWDPTVENRIPMFTTQVPLPDPPSPLKPTHKLGAGLVLANIPLPAV